MTAHHPKLKAEAYAAGVKHGEKIRDPRSDGLVGGQHPSNLAPALIYSLTLSAPGTGELPLGSALGARLDQHLQFLWALGVTMHLVDCLAQTEWEYAGRATEWKEVLHAGAMALIPLPVMKDPTDAVRRAEDIMIEIRTAALRSIARSMPARITVPARSAACT